MGCRARQVAPAVGSQSWLTDKMLRRLKRLKPSAMRSKRTRSPMGIDLETRRSTWKKPGVVKRLRPRLPSQPAGGETPGIAKEEPVLARHVAATPKGTPGMNGEVVAPPIDGRACGGARSRGVSGPVMTLKGRPGAT